MATILNADTISGGFIATGDSSGILQLQSSGTPSLTLNTSGAHGVGSSPSYGTSGQVLQSNGSSAAPSWVTPSSGAMTLISTQTANNTSSNLAWTSLSGYNSYVLNFKSLSLATSDTIAIQFAYGATPTYMSSTYSYNLIVQNGTSAVTTLNSTGQTASSIYLNGTQMINYSNNYSGLGGSLYIESASNGSGYFYSVTGTTTYFNTSNLSAISSVSGNNVTSNANGVITAIRLITVGSNNFYNGTASLYGISS